MLTVLDSSQSLTNEALQQMIADAERSFEFLSRTRHTFTTCRLMLDNHFMFDDKQTPIAASFEFLKRRAEQEDPHNAALDLQDFVFAIKMFGIAVHERKGVMYFLGRNMKAKGVRRVRSGVEDKFVPVPLDDADSIRVLEFYLFSGSKRTKIQLNEIQSATNRLLRDYRDLQLAEELSRLRTTGLSIGEARDQMRAELGVKDHEFARIRAIAIDLGIFKPGRAAAKESSRVMLDPDVQDWLVNVRTQKKKEGVRENQLSMSKLINTAVRELYLMGMGEPLPRVAKPRGEQ
ncbi:MULTISPECIES: hypothetical protein [Cupriavidus]